MANRGNGRAVLALVRLPLLPSAASDPLAGAFLAAPSPPAGPVVAAMAAGVLLYAAGMVTNDLADLEKDRHRHPGRPLPSGRIRHRAAWLLAGILAASGLAAGLCAGIRVFTVACALAGAIALYNSGAKRTGLLGCAVMGSCRGLNLLLGATAAGAPEWVPAGILAAYVACVTAASLGEDHPFRPRRFAATAPLWVIFPAAVAARAATPLLGVAAAAPLAVWLGVALARTRRGSEREGHPLEGFTRRALAGIYLLDAGLLVGATRLAAGAGPLVLWALARLLARTLLDSMPSSQAPRPSSSQAQAPEAAPPWAPPSSVPGSSSPS